MFADISIHSNSLFYVASFLKIKELPLALRLLIWKCTLTFNGVTFQSPTHCFENVSLSGGVFPAASTNQRDRNMLLEDPRPVPPTQETQSLVISQAVISSIVTHSISPVKRWKRSPFSFALEESTRRSYCFPCHWRGSLMKLRIKEWLRLGRSPGDHTGLSSAACPRFRLTFVLARLFPNL